MSSSRRATVAALAPVGFATIAIVTAVGTGAWLGVNAVYRSDDHLVVADAWAGGSLREGLWRWWDAHFGGGIGEGWPRFFRPTWRASYLLDAHLFGCRPAASALFSWLLHLATAWCAARLCRRATGSATLAWFTCATIVLPGAAAQAPLWIAARGSVLATLCTLLAIQVASGGASRGASGAAAGDAAGDAAGVAAGVAVAGAGRVTPRPWRLVVVALLVVLAATSNEVGLAAAPLVSFVLLRGGLRGGGSDLDGAIAPRRQRVAAAAVPWLALAVLLVWRRAMLGGWIGGYGPEPPLRTWFEHAEPVLSAASAVATFGHAFFSRTTMLVAGAALLFGIVALLVRCRGATRELGWTGLGLMVLFVLPFAGQVFGTDDGTSGRALYAVHVGYVLLLAAGLHWRRERSGRPTAGLVLAAVLAGSAALAFVQTVSRYDHAFATARSLFGWLATAPLPAPSVVLGAPDREGSVVLGRNALPAALRRPFRNAPADDVAYATDLDLATSTLTGMAAVLSRLPVDAAWHWNASARRFEPGWSPAPATWRGRVARGPGDTLMCGGLVIAPTAATGWSTPPVPGTWLDALVEPSGRSRDTVLRARRLQPWTPRLQRVDERTWHFTGRAGDWLFLLAGDEPCCLGFGAAGTLGIARPQLVPIRVLDAATTTFELPPVLAGARLLQSFVVNGQRVQLGEVHVLR